MTGRTPTYGITYPDGTTKANKLADELAAMGISVEAALIAAGVPSVTNPDRAVANSDQARNAHFGVPSTEAERLALQQRGAECVRTDKGYTERYFATYNAATNPGGALPAGWYAVAPPLRHAEFTTLAKAMPLGGPNGLGTFTPDANATTSNNFATVVPNGVSLTPGLYAVTGTFVLGGSTPATARTFIDAYTSDRPGEPYRVSIPNGEDRATIALPNLLITTPKAVLFSMYKNNGRPDTDVTGRVAVSRIN